MRARVIALAVPLAMGVGMGCSTSRSQARGGGSEPSASSGAPGSQGALDPLMEPGPAIKGHASDQIVSGAIGDVSADAVSIKSVQGDTTRLEIVPQTSITVNGRDATYAELEEGQQVRASFNQVEGRDVAVEIQIISVAPSDAAAGTSGSAPGTGSTGSGSSGSSGGSSPDGSSTPGGSSDTSGPSDTEGRY